MLRSAIVPNGDIASLPAPAHRVFRLGYVILKNGHEMPRIRAVETHKPLQVEPDQQRALAGLRMNCEHGVLGFNNRRHDSLQPLLILVLVIPVGAEHLSIIEDAAVNPPEILRKNLERL